MFSVDTTPSTNKKSPKVKTPKAKTPTKADDQPKNVKTPKKQQTPKQVKNTPKEVKMEVAESPKDNKKIKFVMKRKSNFSSPGSPPKKQKFNTKFVKKEKALPYSDTIVAKNIPRQTPLEEVKEFFRRYGKIENIDNLTKTVKDAKPVYKIKFSTLEEGKKALDGRELLNGNIVYRRPMNFNARPPVDKTLSLFVSNLPAKCNKTTLKEIFSDCGKVVSVKIIKNKKQQVILYAYVNMLSEQGVTRGLSLDKSEVLGNVIKVRRFNEQLNKKNKEEIKQKQAPSAKVKNVPEADNESDEDEEESEQEDGDDGDVDDEEDDDEADDDNEEGDDSEEDDDDDEDDDEESSEDEEQPVQKKNAKQNVQKKMPFGKKNIQKTTSIMMKIQKPKVKSKAGKA